MCYFDKFFVVSTTNCHSESHCRHHHHHHRSSFLLLLLLSLFFPFQFLLMCAPFFRSEAQFFPNKLLTIHKSRGDMPAELRVLFFRATFLAFFRSIYDRIGTKRNQTKPTGKRVSRKSLVPFAWTTTTAKKTIRIKPKLKTIFLPSSQSVCCVWLAGGFFSSSSNLKLISDNLIPEQQKETTTFCFCFRFFLFFLENSFEIIKLQTKRTDKTHIRSDLRVFF